MPKNLKMFFLLISLFWLAGISTPAQTVKNAPKLTAVKAQLFYDTTGKFSPDILADKEFALWNTIIGEGSAEAPSTSTFVTVEISGTDAGGGLKVELTATGNEGKVLLKKMMDVDLLERTKFYAPFWLYNTGCEPLKLSARLFIKNVQTSSVVKTIPFACGE